MACINKNLPGYKELVNQLGASLTDSIIRRNDMKIPTIEEAVSIIRGSKILQFRKAINYLQNVTSNDIDDLISNFPNILQKIGNSIFIVKGSKLGELVPPIASQEVLARNRKFLEEINRTFGEIFKLPMTAERLRGDVVKAVQNADIKLTGAAAAFKQFADDPSLHDDLINAIVEQALDPASLSGITEMIGKDVVDKALKYHKFIEQERNVPKRLFTDPNPETAIIAEDYKVKHGINTGSGIPITKLDENYSKRIADAFEMMKNDPYDTEVQMAYEAMANETIFQFKSILNRGYKIEIFEGKGEPYANSAEMIKDVRENKHLYVLSTEKEFGQSLISDIMREENPLLRDSSFQDINGKPLLVNDIFRFVHDFFGHTERGNSFGPIGEENAWDVHVRMYTPLAARAMTTETRGQNSWVNFGPHMRNKEGNIKKKNEEGYLDITQRPFAEQKIGLLPEEFSTPPSDLGIERPGSSSFKVEIDNNVLSNIIDNNTNKKETPVPDESRYQKVETNPSDYITKGNFFINNMVSMLSKRFNIPVEFINDDTQRWAGKFNNGKVTLNEAYMNGSTPFHEFFHPIILNLKQENPELYKKLIEELKSSEEGKAAIVRVAERYPELNQEDQLDEALVSLLGNVSTARAFESKPIYQRFMNWLKSVLARMGIRVEGFRTNMEISEVADLILDPLFVKDLSRVMDKSNLSEYYQKVYSADLNKEYQSLLTDTIRKLKADAAIPGKTQEEKTRKFFSGRHAEILENNPKDVEALDNFILSSLINLKKLREKFEEFKEKYDAKKIKTRQDIDELSRILNEIEDNVALYNDVDNLLDAAIEAFPDADDNFNNFKLNFRNEKKLVRGYQTYGKKLIVDWLFPYMKKSINKALNDNNIFSVVSESTYNAVKQRLKDKGITDNREILNHAVKEELESLISLAKKDASGVTQYLGPVLHSRDTLSSLIGLAITDELTKALKKGLHLQDRLKNLVRQVRGNLLFANNNDHKTFYEKYLRKAKSYEYQGLDENLKPKYKLIDRWAFHEEFLWDEFYDAKRKFFEKIGPQPSKNDVAKFNAWKAKREQWLRENTISSVDAQGRLTTIPNNIYKNPSWQGLQQDTLFKEIYGAYKQANEKLGQQGLKYGIIPQSKAAGITIPTKEDLKSKNILEKVRGAVGEEEQVYFAQKIDGYERQTVPISMNRLLDEQYLSFDLLDSVSKFSTMADKYHAMSQIDPHVQVLKNFIGGNANLKIDPRKAIKSSSSGIKSLIKGERSIMPIEAVRINKQLDSFLNDVVYGQSMRKEVIQMWDAKFEVYDKNDTSDNGKPKITVIKGFENLMQYLNAPNLDYHGFKYNEERNIAGKTIKMVKKDWNFSVKKFSDNMGLLGAFTNMVLNPTSATVNIIRGKLETFVEAIGGKYFNIKDALFGEKEYYKALASGDFFEDLKGSKPSFLSEMAIHYEAIQGELMDVLGRKVKSTIAGKLFRRSNLFLLQNGGEHYLQTQLMIAMMHNQKVNLSDGSITNLYDARKREFIGELKSSDINWSEEDDRGFKERLQFVNVNAHGNYNKLDKALLQRSWWGSLVMMFRKHIYTGFASRYRKGYVNMQSGEYVQGYYRTFWNGLTRELRDIVRDRKVSQFSLSPEEQYAFRKLAADLGGFMLLIAAFGMFDDDDDENEFNDWVALVSRRLLSESVQYAPGIGTMDLLKVVKDPAVSVNTITKYWEVMEQLSKDAWNREFEEYTRSGPGYEKGDTKSGTKLLRVIPGWRQVVNIQEPERLMQFYRDNSFWFFKPSAGKEESEDEKREIIK